MSQINHQQLLTDDDIKRIEQRAWSLSPFDEGERVTVEPTDHGISYASKELEGQPLVIDGVALHDSLHYAKPKELKARDSLSDTELDRRLVEVDGFVQQEHVGDHPQIDYQRVYLSRVQHTFEDTDRFSPMPTSSLITWDEFRTEYDQPIVLDAEYGTRKRKQTKLCNADSECEVCGSTKIIVSGTEDDVLGWYGTESCAACGEVFSETHP